ncbi:glycosyltransferase family 4 protein [Dietzia maris]
MTSDEQSGASPTQPNQPVDERPPVTSPSLKDKKIIYTTTIGSSTWSFLEGQLAHFRERGADVIAVCTPDRLFAAATERERVKGHGIHMEREISPRSDIKALASWITLLRLEKPDVINAGTPKAALLGLISSTVTGVPTRIYTVRGLRYETTTGTKRRVLRLIETLCCALSTHVIAVSHGVALQMKKDRITKSPIIVIGDGSSNGVRAQDIAERADQLDPSECRRIWSVPANRLVVGFVGRITPDKGGDCITKALQLIHERRPDLDFALLVVGEAEDPDAVSTLNKVPYPTYTTGWIDDTVPAFRAMDILCLPTKREGFPNVVLEAGAVSLPTVTTTATGARESVIDGVTGHLVPVDDPSALADALIEIGNSSRLRTAMGKAARERAIKLYPPERIWTALESLYQGTAPADTTYY